MEVKEMGIGELRRELSDRLDAAFFRGEPTIIRNIRRSRPTAALVPYEWVEELETARAELAKYRAAHGPLKP